MYQLWVNFHISASLLEYQDEKKLDSNKQEISKENIQANIKRLWTVGKITKRVKDTCIWIKKNNCKFNVKLGSYNKAEICELVESFLECELLQLFLKNLLDFTEVTT